jgi:hypothetical protein
VDERPYSALWLIVACAIPCVLILPSAATDIAPDRIATRSWDTMYGAKTDALRGSKTGRLLQYDPKTDEVTVLARNLHFPNGIAVDRDETYVLFGETFTLRMLQYFPAVKKLKVVNDGGLTGYPDGVDCAWQGVTATQSSLCYAVMPSAILPLIKGIMKLPHPIDMFARSFLMGLHKNLAPRLKPYGGIVEINPENGGIRFIQDPVGTDILALAGVTVFDNKLYLGSLHNEYIGVYEL